MIARGKLANELRRTYGLDQPKPKVYAGTVHLTGLHKLADPEFMTKVDEAIAAGRSERERLIFRDHAPAPPPTRLERLRSRVGEWLRDLAFRIDPDGETLY